MTFHMGMYCSEIYVLRRGCVDGRLSFQRYLLFPMREIGEARNAVRFARSAEVLSDETKCASACDNRNFKISFTSAVRRDRCTPSAGPADNHGSPPTVAQQLPNARALFPNARSDLC